MCPPRRRSITSSPQRSAIRSAPNSWRRQRAASRREWEGPRCERCAKLKVPRPAPLPAREIAHGAGLSKPISYLDMILVAAAVTYFCDMQGLSPAGNSPRLRDHVEDQQLQNAPIISIIDDDESMRCAIKSLVTSLGLDANTFASAEAFLQSPHLDHTSCVITDLQMPGLNGVELQKSLLAQGRRIPIIFVTAFPKAPASRARARSRSKVKR